jgi:hypothetical protein
VLVGAGNNLAVSLVAMVLRLPDTYYSKITIMSYVGLETRICAGKGSAIYYPVASPVLSCSVSSRYVARTSEQT